MDGDSRSPTAANASAIARARVLFRDRPHLATGTDQQRPVHVEQHTADATLRWEYRRDVCGDRLQRLAVLANYGKVRRRH